MVWAETRARRIQAPCPRSWGGEGVGVGENGVERRAGLPVGLAPKQGSHRRAAADAVLVRRRPLFFLLLLLRSFTSRWPVTGFFSRGAGHTHQTSPNSFSACKFWVDSFAIRFGAWVVAAGRLVRQSNPRPVPTTTHEVHAGESLEPRTEDRRLPTWHLPSPQRSPAVAGRAAAKWAARASAHRVRIARARRRAVRKEGVFCRPASNQDARGRGGTLGLCASRPRRPR